MPNEGGINLGGLFSGGTGGMILYFVVIIAIFYFLMIRPQRKKEKEQKNLLDSLKKGDQIITIGGFYGKIISVKDEVVTVQIDQTRAKIEKSAVKTVVKSSNHDEALDGSDDEVTDENE